MKQTEKILEVNGLKKYFAMGRKNVLKAVDNVSFYIHKGETLQKKHRLFSRILILLWIPK